VKTDGKGGTLCAATFRMAVFALSQSGSAIWTDGTSLPHSSQQRGVHRQKHSMQDGVCNEVALRDLILIADYRMEKLVLEPAMKSA
jgi:hypothetical protein